MIDMMTAEQLKDSILLLAMQGKLVEQKPEEGTGEELYKKIQAEKKRLINEGKIKKHKSQPDISEVEIPFDIPETWKWTHLDSSITLLSGADLTPEKYNSNEKGTVYITGASNIENGKVIINRWTEYPKNIAHKGDLLLTCKGTVGKTAILELNEAHIARQIMAITPIICCVDYVNYYIQFIVTDLKKKAKSMIPGIERASVLNAPFPLPPLSEQKRIVAKIEELMPFVEQYAVASTKLNTLNTTFPEMMKKSILQEAVQGKLVPQDPNDEPASLLLKKIAEEKKKLIKNGLIKKSPKYEKVEPPFEIPEKWSWTRLYELLNFIDYRGKTPQKLDSGIDLIGAWNIKQGYLDMSKNHKYISRREYETRKGRGLTKKGDILFITEGGTMGNACINTLDCECTCGQRVITLQEFGSVNLCMEYYMYVILSPYFQSMIAANATGSAAMGIKAAVLKTFWVPVPPFEEQKRIVEKAKELIQLTDKMTQ